MIKWSLNRRRSKWNCNQSGITGADYSNFVKESYKRNVHFFSKENLPIQLKLFRMNYFQLWDEKKRVQICIWQNCRPWWKFSFVFVMEITIRIRKRDFENTDKHLEVGGYSFRWQFGLLPFGCIIDERNRKDGSLWSGDEKSNYLFRKKADKWISPVHFDLKLLFLTVNSWFFLLQVYMSGKILKTLRSRTAFPSLLLQTHISKPSVVYASAWFSFTERLCWASRLL